MRRMEMQFSESVEKRGQKNERNPVGLKTTMKALRGVNTHAEFRAGEDTQAIEAAVGIITQVGMGINTEPIPIIPTTFGRTIGRPQSSLCQIGTNPRTLARKGRPKFQPQTTPAPRIE